MTQVPPGTITLRDDRLKKSWVVEVRAFAIGRYPVTQAQYASVVGRPLTTNLDADCPVTMVSWSDAADFCNRLSEAHGLKKH
jgi:formylglycine-generating enzyme required for sulfatase activity